MGITISSRVGANEQHSGTTATARISAFGKLGQRLGAAERSGTQSKALDIIDGGNPRILRYGSARNGSAR